ncbi:unnamed protein product, partial [marine sediment metagenome]
MKDLSEKVTALLTRVSFVEEEIERQQKGVSTAKLEIDRLEKVIDLNARAVAFMTVLFEKLNEKGLAVLDKLLEGALIRIFPERDYSVTHNIVMSRGANQLSFFLREVKAGGKVVVSNVRNAVGGGVRAVIGLVCLCFYLIKMEAERIIVMDEALSQIDDTSVDNLFDFMGSFAKDAG